MISGRTLRRLLPVLITSASTCTCFQSVALPQLRRYPRFPPLLVYFNKNLALPKLPSTVKTINYPTSMLIRVRSNFGTWKVHAQKEDDIETLLRDDKFATFRLVRPLSIDAGCHHALTAGHSLEELGLAHGSIVYCRLEESSVPTDDDTRKGTNGSELITASRQKDSACQTESTHQEIKSAKIHFGHRKNNERNINVENDSSDDVSVNLLLASSDEDEKHTADDSDDLDYPRRKKGRQSKSTKRPISASTKGSSPTAKKKVTGKRRTEEPSEKSLGGDNCQPPISFQIASYNIWFGPPDPTARQVYPAERMMGVAQALQEECCISEHPLLFIGFQEVTTSLKQHLQPLLQQMGYKFCTQPLGDFYGIGLAIPNDLEIVESKFVPYSDTTQGRGLLFVQTQQVLFCTTHLESFVDAKTYDGVRQRENQIQQATQFVEERLNTVPGLQIGIVSGDFNWDDERKRGNGPNRPLLSILSDDGWRDAGEPFDYTYDGKENPMLKSNLRRRFDRIIWLGKEASTKQQKNSTYTSTRLTKIGMAAIPGLIWQKNNPYNGTTRPVPVAPSDHFGIAVSFETNKKVKGRKEAEKGEKSLR